MDETRIQLWVNLICKLVCDAYVPYQAFTKPADDTYKDIHLSPNGKFFQVFEDFDL